MFLFAQNAKIVFVFLFVFVVGLIQTTPVFALEDKESGTSGQISTQKDEVLEGNITQILEEKQVIPMGQTEFQLNQKLEVLVTKGSLENKKIEVQSGNLPVTNLQKYKIGDDVIINFSKDFEGKDNFVITDYVRRNSLALLFVIFVAVAVVIGRIQGATSLLGMGISFLVIFVFILPRISSGDDPVLTAIIGSLVIIPTTFFLSHGVNKKTGVAMAGTFFALAVTGLLAAVFVEASKLTGFGSEEASFLQSIKPGFINIKGLLLAGMIISVLGILDDVTVSQASIVEQLKKANPKFSTRELYSKAMAVGKDHIASVVNTLVLVYTGASLPLLLLFIDNPQPFSQVVNYEMIADEIVKTLVGSIGLMLAVPITTLIASIMSERNA
ncbi:MAG: hypothetical protein A3D24_00430 [Candidatus Blackburnbacteria bacterium RIFCSPHIGHO2_02_FULL_39_13]|uniref:YibE/F family protein n=1 Tax=Candidatus Blackburnbacteria bacterium RIFCSPLOWO2_01_FULL_40_20 TaxID=1797519 RepID=A0A1G1VFU0_9BACT|nr:MAG: hypothetical protein UT38_C0003G0004 [Microgenomates group bacterium GW2011_GWA2_39_19]OGY07543.1 MAG: hypothetical protein A2694_04780 [Candidatus Blackburnbacteria bacterium RIFCSPHIGHO2_01_FULL_40_17]OGY08626.1 MAG: hypothetical protein A3D24_00430 [Candidatus Blackburnbacteria bacterium RIFCSPHIGHO2_02_FULL_39_13]OGY14260.1 MAG: hypothetical protein A3A77_02175 [Candidatus Blackburnbacteria bacterium RIFCSPLOWO2_01_FULL_40_20]OGY14587.1 MAG: hypothetical protein A3I52_00385 [Candida